MSLSEPSQEASLITTEKTRIVSTYAALGDSFTAGHGALQEDGEPWPDRVATRLRRVNPELTYRNLAVDGAPSADVLEQVPTAIAMEPDLVTIICGANDVLLTTRPDVAAYETQFAQILERLRAALPDAAIVTTTAPEGWHFMELRRRTKARLAEALTALNEATPRIAAEHGVLCLEVAGHPALSDRASFSADGLHPSDLGNRVVARELGKALGLHFGIQGDFAEDPDGEEER
jgi:lysophospholipase L1-like esterase